MSWERAHTSGSAVVTIEAVNTDGTESTDASSTDAGYQVDLTEGENVITSTVTAPNAVDTYTFPVTVTRAPS